MSNTDVAPEDYTGPKDFVHLHNHTVYSVLDGVATPEQYADECAKRGYVAMSATEHGHMASVPDMHFAFRKQGLKYIPGCEIYFNDYEPFRKKVGDLGIKLKKIREDKPFLAQRISRNRHLTILCKNEVGFHNLIKLTTEAYQFGFYYRPRIWFDKLCEYKEGLIILSGCLNGPVAHEIRLDAQMHFEENKKPERVKGLDQTAVQYIKKFKKVFGDDYFMEVQMPCLPEIYDHVAFWKLVEYSDKYGIPIVLANDSHYLNRADFYIQKVMMAVGQGTTIDDPNMFHVNSDEQYMKTRAELWATFKNNSYSDKVDDRKFEEMCDNTLLVADKCSGIDPDTNLKIPDWSTIEAGKDGDKELCRIAMKGLKKKGLDKVKKKYLVDGRMVTYTEQMKIELDRFISKGFASYFLLTWDMLMYGKKQGWPFGPRGSAGGSLVCYLIDIHALDPLKWELSFDRFMASSRGGYQLKVTME
jgi:DNA polymerase-3 subunit alpha